MKILVVIIAAMFGMGCKEVKRATKENPDVILIDSIPLKSGKTVFWYKLRDLLGTSSVSYIGIYDCACNIDTSNFLVKGDLLYEIKLLKSNQLQITSHYGFDIIRKTMEIEFVDKHFEYGQKFNRNTIQEDILLDSLCSSSHAGR